jgi:hypothetical protein
MPWILLTLHDCSGLIRPTIFNKGTRIKQQVAFVLSWQEIYKRPFHLFRLPPTFLNLFNSPYKGKAVNSVRYLLNLSAR